MNHSQPMQYWRPLILLTLLALLTAVPLPQSLGAAPDKPQLHHLRFTDINGPPGSEAFGTHVLPLVNGNVIITDPLYDADTTPNVGAIYLYNGVTRSLISMITGSTAEDRIGNAGISILPNGNFIINSLLWDNGAALNAGAITWCSGVSGCTGTVSPSNSLVGTTSNDQVGGYLKQSKLYPGVTILTNGNFVISSPLWDNGEKVNAGAVTWCSGAKGCTGAISPSNSLVGTTSNDQVGGYPTFLSPDSKIETPVLPLANGNYVVRTPSWDNGGMVDVGAATWGSGELGVTGPISAQNSLIGSKTREQVSSDYTFGLKNGNYLVFSAGTITWAPGTTGITGTVSAQNSHLRSGKSGSSLTSYRELTNGNYVIFSPYWSGTGIAAGAITWVDGTKPFTGTVSTENSLVGSSTNDNLGLLGVIALSNGHYVIPSPSWSNGSLTDVGAITWVDGTQPITGTISEQNSLIGSAAGDQLGSGTRHGGSNLQGYFFYGGITPLKNSNYVVVSPYWNNGGINDAGAITWADGTKPITGTISLQNSLVGDSASDHLGAILDPGENNQGVTELTNGNFVVRSTYLDNNGWWDVGAVTWGDGTKPLTGTISYWNSLIGGSYNDHIGSLGVTALSNGNYVVRSHVWDNRINFGSDAGAVTWGNGRTGTAGAVHAQNSFVGSLAGDMVGNMPIIELANGDYVISTPSWNNGNITDAGAVTWASGTSAIIGTIHSYYSLTGTTPNEKLGESNVLPLRNGGYVVASSRWDNGTSIDVGAVSWRNGQTPLTGPVSAQNSLVGLTSSDLLGSGVLDSSSNPAPGGLYGFENGYFAIVSPYWSAGEKQAAGMVTILSQEAIRTGAPPLLQSVIGRNANSGPTMFTAYNAYNQHMLVSTPADNRVIFVSIEEGSLPATYVPLLNTAPPAAK